LLNFLNGFGYLNATRAGIGAVEGGTAAPDTFFVVENLKASTCTCITAIKDEPVGGNNCGWAEVLLVGPKDRA
jgi:hypothetical protein